MIDIPEINFSVITITDVICYWKTDFLVLGVSTVYNETEGRCSGHQDYNKLCLWSHLHYLKKRSLSFA